MRERNSSRGDPVKLWCVEKFLICYAGANFDNSLRTPYQTLS